MKEHNPAPTRADHKKFWVVEGWSLVSNAKGKKGSHHIAYELNLPDGSILRTRISHPPNKSTYGKTIWSHILRDQLQVSESEFWSCVKSKVKPARSKVTQPGQGVPLNIVYTLVKRFGLPESEVAAMSRDEAIETANRLWSSGPNENTD